MNVNSDTIALCANKADRNAVNLDTLRDLSGGFPIITADATFAVSFRGSKTFEDTDGTSSRSFYCVYMDVLLTKNI